VLTRDKKYYGKVLCYGCLRSIKVIEIAPSRKLVCDFLLVAYSRSELPPFPRYCYEKYKNLNFKTDFLHANSRLLGKVNVAVRCVPYEIAHEYPVAQFGLFLTLELTAKTQL